MQFTKRPYAARNIRKNIAQHYSRRIGNIVVKYRGYFTLFEKSCSYRYNFSREASMLKASVDLGLVESSISLHKFPKVKIYSVRSRSRDASASKSVGYSGKDSILRRGDQFSIDTSTNNFLANRLPSTEAFFFSFISLINGIPLVLGFFYNSCTRINECKTKEKELNPICLINLLNHVLLKIMRTRCFLNGISSL